VERVENRKGNENGKSQQALVNYVLLFYARAWQARKQPCNSILSFDTRKVWVAKDDLKGKLGAYTVRFCSMRKSSKKDKDNILTLQFYLYRKSSGSS